LDKDTELFEQKLKEKLVKKDFNFRGYFFPEWAIFDFNFRNFIFHTSIRCIPVDQSHEVNI